MIWKFCGQTWLADDGPAVMGIVNVTPDSFSDGGHSFNTDTAVNHARQHWQDGALWVDIGGESTRPGAEPVEESEELQRVLPVLEKLSKSKNDSQWISIDTMKSTVARQAVSAGAIVVNDVSGLNDEDGMLDVLASSDCGYILTHCLGTPQTMQKNPQYTDCLREVIAFFEKKLTTLRNAGVALERIVLDPGFGFGKKWQHNRQLLLGLREICSLGRPVLAGLSRKSFIGMATGADASDRLAGSLAAETLAVWHGAALLRTHEPRQTLQAAKMAKAIFLGSNLT